VIVRFADIGRIVDHHCLEVIVRFAGIGGIIDHHCLEVIVRFADIGGIVDHHCLKVLFIIGIKMISPTTIISISSMNKEKMTSCLARHVIC